MNELNLVSTDVVFTYLYTVTLSDQCKQAHADNFGCQNKRVSMLEMLTNCFRQLQWPNEHVVLLRWHAVHQNH